MLRAATFVGAISVVLSLIGFLRWVFVVPPLADAYAAGNPTTQAAVAAAWTAQHQFGGALLGEHLGQLLVIAWSVTVSLLVLRSGMLARWAGWTGLAASGLYLTGQGDILATAILGFPVWDLGGLLGSTLWGLWVIALGVAVLRAPIRRPWATPSPPQPQQHHEQTQHERPAAAWDRAADRPTQGGVVDHRLRPYGARLGHEGGTTCG